MRIEVTQLTLAKKKVPLILLEVIRCPDGVYGVCVKRTPANDGDRTILMVPTNQLMVDEKFWAVPKPKVEVAPDATNKDIVESLDTIAKELKKLTKPSTTKKKPINE